MSRHLKGRCIGVNLTPDKRCNYRCVYCEVDRSLPAPADEFSPAICRDELEALLARLQREKTLDQIRGIALAGEGEPTSCVLLPQVVAEVAEALHRYRMPTTRLVLMTNGTCLHTPCAKDSLARMREAGGEIWIKLDAGTQVHMNAVNGTFYPIETLTDKIISAGCDGEIVLHSVFLNRRGVAPSQEEVSAYVDRVKTIRTRGARIKKVQVCTIARPLAEDGLTPLNFHALSAIAGCLEDEAGVRVGVL
ncbi:radical SAM protein [Desulfoluna limicola]|nr:radical SAM protein [Desulfoluna limicola]